MRVLRWGILGCGRFGAVHARALERMPAVELAALCTRDPQRLAQLQRDFPGCRAYRDAREMLRREALDVVSVTTHWQEHFDATCAVLEAGCHVLVEKPLAATAAQCLELVRRSEQASGLMMVGHVCRFDPRICHAREAVAAGQIGRIVSMHAKRNLPRAPGRLRLDKIPPLIGDGIHDADIMMWLIGAAPSRVYGRTVRAHEFQYPDLGWAMLEFGNQAVGVVETVWCLPETAPTVIDARLEVIGTEGTLVVDCSQTGFAQLTRDGLRMRDTAYWPEVHGQVTGALRNELDYFADCVRCGRAPAVITPREAARAFLVMDAAEQSAASGQPVDYRDPWPPPQAA